jgi:hypothetical protein
MNRKHPYCLSTGNWGGAWIEDKKLHYSICTGNWDGVVSYGWEISIFHICRKLRWGCELRMRNINIPYLQETEKGVVTYGWETSSLVHIYRAWRLGGGGMWATNGKYLYSTSAGNCNGVHLWVRNIIVIPDLQRCLWTFEFLPATSETSCMGQLLTDVNY